MEEENYRVFKTIDNMPRILFWGADQFTIIFAPIFLGIVIGGFFALFAIFLGPFLGYLYWKVTKKYPRGAIRHKLYWHLPKEVFSRNGKLKNIPASHIREYTL